MNGIPFARERNVTLCHVCSYVCPEDVHECPRCDSAVHTRKPNSLIRTWAFLIAGLIFYIPANTLPVMFTTLLGSASENTIMSGVIEFAEGAPGTSPSSFSSPACWCPASSFWCWERC